MNDYSIENGAHILLRFTKLVEKNEFLRRGRSIPKNLYLVKCPRKNQPFRKMWRVKRQYGGIVFVKHFEDCDKNIAYELASRISLMTKDEFVNLQM